MARAELCIESIAAGGDGVGRAGSLVVFVPRTAPGDEIVADIATRARFARGRLVSVVASSDLRTDPPCPHYTTDRCGGCQLQHLRYEAQLDAKARIVRDALERIGKRAVPEVVVRPSPARWRYRRKLTLALRPRGGRWIAGLHPFDDPSRVFPLADCPISDERIVATWRAVIAASGMLPDARELRGAVRLDENGTSLVLEGGARWPLSRRFFEAVPAIDAVWWVPEGGARRLIHSRGAADAPGATFAQVNAAVAAELSAHVVASVLTHRPTKVIDGYAGLGGTAMALASAGAQVVAVELDPDAAAWCAARLPDGSRAIAARVEDVLQELLPSDVVILNPPRTGIDARVAAALEGAHPRPSAVIYVSCNPATLARDLTRLPGYSIASIAGFDMFPQTAHVETVCELVPDPK